MKCVCGHDKKDHDKSGCHSFLGEYGMEINRNLFFVPCQNNCKKFQRKRTKQKQTTKEKEPGFFEKWDKVIKEM